MRISRLAAAAAALAFAVAGAPGIAQDPKQPVTTLKAAEQNSDIDIYKWEGDRAPIPRDFVQQPPLIPHSIKGYQITKNFNKCLDCHAWSQAPKSGATKVSITHFKDRDGKELSNISPARYFCTQCHVPQTDADPLVKNTFKPVDGLARKK